MNGQKAHSTQFTYPAPKSSTEQMARALHCHKLTSIVENNNTRRI